MKRYQDYIFDFDNRRLRGDFDGAYRAFSDVWPSQHDTHILKFQSILWRARERHPGVRLLDVGAGYGDFVRLATRSGLDCTGVEVSSAAVSSGRARLGPMKMVAADLRRGLPFADGRFDIVVVFGVFQYLMDATVHAVDELRRVLAEDGLLAASTTLPAEPIGKEYLAGYPQFVECLRRRFTVSEAFLGYDHEDLAAGKPICECATDFIAYCRPA
jgi:SAM-dependent methyltransferase